MQYEASLLEQGGCVYEHNRVWICLSKDNGIGESCLLHYRLKKHRHTSDDQIDSRIVWLIRA